MTFRTTVDEKLAEQHVRGLLRALGQDAEREGLARTPERVVKMWLELLVPTPFEFTAFDAEKNDEMVVQTGVRFYSVCEHHMVPFYGTAAVGYLPNGRLVGLSKLARAVQYCAKGLQNQERITTAVADLIEEAVQPRGVGVVLVAEHLCMSMRGVKAHGATTQTSCLRGVFREDALARAEFLDLALGRRP